jgi:hypothetical protein
VYSRVNGLRPLPGLARGKLKQIVANIGVGTAASVLGESAYLIGRAVQGFPIETVASAHLVRAIDSYLSSQRSQQELPDILTTKIPVEEKSLSRLEATDLFRTLIWDRAKDVDPSDQYDWFSMAYGFFIACGFSLEDAANLAYLVCDTDFFEK